MTVRLKENPTVDRKLGCTMCVGCPVKGRRYNVLPFELVDMGIIVCVAFIAYRTPAKSSQVSDMSHQKVVTSRPTAHVPAY